MANTFTSPNWIKSVPHASAELQVGDADAATDVINRPTKGLWANLRRIVNSLFDGVTVDATDQATVSSLGNINLSGNKLLGLGAGTVGAASISPTGDDNTGVFFSAADVVDITGGGVRLATFATVALGVNYLRVRPSATTSPVLIDAQGNDVNIGVNISTKGNGTLSLLVPSGGAVQVTTNGVARTTTNDTAFTAEGSIPIVPAAVSGTPAQHGLFRENVVKGWAKVQYSAGVPSIADGFNALSITDDGTGLFTITWDRDFANTTFAAVGSGVTAGHIVAMVAITVGVSQFQVSDAAAAAIDGNASVILMGDQ